MKINEKGVLIFYDWIDGLKSLDGAEAFSVVCALADYSRYGTDPVGSFEGALKTIVSLMFEQIKRAEEISEIRAQNAIATNEKRKANAERAQSERKANAKRTQCGTTYSNTNTDTNIISPPIIPPLGGEKEASGDAPSADVDVIEQRFDRFWSEYPNKTGKQAARVAWRKIKPSDKLTCQMIEKLREMKKTAQWVREGGRFVPNPATWLNQGRWEDEAPKEQAQAAQAQAQPRLQTAPQKERFGNFDHEQAFRAAIIRSALSMGMSEEEAEEYAKQHV